MANEQNIEKNKGRLKGNSEEASNMGKKGGIASGEARRAKKSMAEMAAIMLNSKLDAKGRENVKKLCKDLADEDATVQSLMLAGQVQSAIKGNTKAFVEINSLMDRVASKDDGKAYELPARVMGKAFVDINRRIQPNISYVFKGGRGGLKSSYVSLKLIEIIKNNPTMHACVVRKVGNTLRDSVFAQVKWAINELGLTDEFESKVNPLEITYKKTGQKIFFRACDDPMKLKSIKTEFGYIGILWIEERDQLNGAEEERNVKQSVLRGGMLSYDFCSYNPPKSKSNWVNLEELIPNDKRVIHSCTYMEAPIEWLGQKFIDDAEHLKEVNPTAYEHEYLGIPNGEGGNVFEYLEIRDITDEEISHMDTIYQGVDWGWVDPFVFIRIYYETDSDKIFLIDERYITKTPNSINAQWILDKGYDDYPITCDSAEPKSANDFRDLGLNAKLAMKGAGSIEYGMKFLAGRKIVIDPKRTPNAYKEFVNYEYERDKDGNVVSGFPDKDNHSIDATRYALEKFYNKRGNQA